MTEQKQTNPLPDGRYWISVFGDKIPAFDDWLRDNKDSVKVEVSSKVEETLTNPEENFVIFKTRSNVPVPGGTATIFIPLNFDAARFGFPNFAPASIKSREDTQSGPDLPADGSTVLGDVLGQGGLLGGLESGLKIAGYGFAAWFVWGLLTRGSSSAK